MSVLTSARLEADSQSSTAIQTHGLQPRSVKKNREKYSENRCNMSNYAFKFDHAVFTPNGRSAMTTGEVERHNKMISENLLIEWATQPVFFCAYADTNKMCVMLWTGEIIGHISRVTTFCRYTKDGIRYKMACITVEGSNGAIYHGRFGSDWAMLVRLHKVTRDTKKAQNKVQA
jgi:hypothetical protein